jgi:hypothetical protein
VQFFLHHINSSHLNETTMRNKRMVNETADFLARAVAAFFSRIGRPVKMRGGTDDIDTFATSAW